MMVAAIYTPNSGAITQVVTGSPEAIAATAGALTLAFVILGDALDLGNCDAFDQTHRVLDGEVVPI